MTSQRGSLPVANPRGIEIMKRTRSIESSVPVIINHLSRQWGCPLKTNGRRGLNPTGQKAVHKVLMDMISILFPGCHSPDPVPATGLTQYFRQKLEATILVLKSQTRRAFE
jgi:hypothetical protein